MKKTSPRGTQGAEALGRLLGLLVHDLRNPAATISANLSFLQDVGIDFPDDDAREAFEDLRLAAAELQRGLEQTGWIVRWLLREPAVAASPGEAGAACQRAAESHPRLSVRVDSQPPSLAARHVRGGRQGLPTLLGLLLSNAQRHAPGSEVVLRLCEDPEGLLRIEVHDAGPRIPEEAAEAAFTVEGQHAIKHLGAQGRYGRFLELLAARAVAEALGIELAAGTPPDGPSFVLRVPTA